MVNQEIVRRIRNIKTFRKFSRQELRGNNPWKPSFVHAGRPASVFGKPSENRLLVLRSPPCEYAMKDRLGGCTECPFPREGNPEVELGHLIHQFDNHFDGNFHGRLSLLTGGSTFHPGMPFEFWEYAMERLKGSKVKEVDLEATALEIIGNAEKISRLRDISGKPLNFGIGLETLDNFVREVLMRKPLKLDDFERAIGTLAGLGVGGFAYIILKPLGLEEEEAVQECISTIGYFFRLADEKKLERRKVVLQPLFVGLKTIVEQLFEEGLHTPPKLWSLIAVLKETYHLGHIFVPLCDENTSSNRTAGNCNDCTPKIESALGTFNASQDIGPLLEVSCGCREAWETEQGEDYDVKNPLQQP